MKIDTLEKLYHDQIAGLHHGDEQLLKFLSRMLTTILHAELRDQIRALVPQIRAQAGRIEHIMPRNPITEQGHDSPGMRGLLDEAHVFLERASDASVIDAGMLSLLQRIIHYSISSYGAVRTYASMLNLENDAQELQRSLDELKDADRRLTEVAMDGINSDALNSGSLSAG
jgi:ferritin-like metal-binding protein YciE